MIQYKQINQKDQIEFNAGFHWYLNIVISVANVGQRVHFSQGIVWIRMISMRKRTDEMQKFFFCENHSNIFVFYTKIDLHI